MTGRCETCKWWGEDDDDRFDHELYRDKWYYRRRVCVIATGKDGYPKFPASLAAADDGESYSAVLRTLPDFGCVQWEARPQHGVCTEEADALKAQGGAA